jgi:hypothetical protein
MAFPHPQSRKHHDRKEDVSRLGSIVGQLLKRTKNISEYRDSEDDVYPANYRTLSGFFHDDFSPPSVIDKLVIAKH